MTRTEEFVLALASDDELNELRLVHAVTWYLEIALKVQPVTLDLVVDFLDKWRVRTNINKYRLRSKLVRDREISITRDGVLKLPLKKEGELSDLYSQYIKAPVPKVTDQILEASEFSSGRKYVRRLVHQINACRQFELYDGCAVLMRRLMEVLIIDAYEAKKNSRKDTPQ